MPWIAARSPLIPGKKWMPPVILDGISGFKVWMGSAYVVKPVMVWTGSAWIEKPLKDWTGGSWLTRVV